MTFALSTAGAWPAQKADRRYLVEQIGLNSRVEKVYGKVVEQVWRSGTPGGKVPPGRYAQYIRAIFQNLEKAAEHAEPAQADVLRKLIRYYQTGEQKDWYDYNIAWVKAAPTVDAINGFSVASTSEDPANRRAHGGGVRRLALHLVPMPLSAPAGVSEEVPARLFPHP